MSAVGIDRKALPFPRFGLGSGRWISPVVLLLLWELGSRTGFISPRVLAAPSAVAGTFWSMIVSGELPSNLLVSLTRSGLGLGLGLLVGGALALIAGLSRVGEVVIDPLMQIKRMIPSLALTPLLIVWFGIGETPKIALIFLGVIFAIYLNLYSAIRNVDVKLLEAGRTFGLSWWEQVIHIVLPGAMPGFFVGLRLASGGALMLLVVAEQINSQAGIGHLINDARDFMRTDIIVVCLLVYTILGLTADVIVRALEARTLRWRPALIKS
jgi:sulfonate transport system permease protein